MRKKIKNREHDWKHVKLVVEIKIHSNWKGSIFDGEIIFFVVFKKQLSLLAIVLTNLDTPIDRINVRVANVVADHDDLLIQ